MQAAVENRTYTQQFPIDSNDPQVKKEINASALWKKIVHNAWKSAEPGVLFWDTILRESVPDCYADLGFRTVSTNPCGEIPLCPYDSCRLLAINLYSYVVNPFTPEAYFDLNYSRNMSDWHNVSWTTLSIWNLRKSKKSWKRLIQTLKVKK